MPATSSPVRARSARSGEGRRFSNLGPWLGRSAAGFPARRSRPTSSPASGSGFPADGPGSVASIGARIGAFVIDAIVANLLAGLPYLFGVRYSPNARGFVDPRRVPAGRADLRRASTGRPSASAARHPRHQGRRRRARRPAVAAAAHGAARRAGPGRGLGPRPPRAARQGVRHRRRRRPQQGGELAGLPRRRRRSEHRSRRRPGSAHAQEGAAARPAAQASPLASAAALAVLAARAAPASGIGPFGIGMFMAPIAASRR